MFKAAYVISFVWLTHWALLLIDLCSKSEGSVVWLLGLKEAIPGSRIWHPRETSAIF
jgi:hypothetical protein